MAAADHIDVMDKGTVTEHGTHEQLLGSAVWQSQSLGCLMVESIDLTGQIDETRAAVCMEWLRKDCPRKPKGII